jgi:predicted XRE-type DNA-binding protein
MGNGFTDASLPNADDAVAKAKLAEAIAEAIERSNLTQTETAAILGVDQPKVSKIVNGRLDGFTQDRLTGQPPPRHRPAPIAWQTERVLLEDSVGMINSVSMPMAPKRRARRKPPGSFP